MPRTADKAKAKALAMRITFLTMDGIGAFSELPPIAISWQPWWDMPHRGPRAWPAHFGPERYRYTCNTGIGVSPL
jgi:hypothetical protein